MIRTAFALILSGISLAAASCCCTSDTKPPKLRALPQFEEIQAEAPASLEVRPEK